MAEEEAKKEETKSEKKEDASDLSAQAKTQKWLNNATITLIQWFPLGSSGWLLVSFIAFFIEMRYKRREINN